MNRIVIIGSGHAGFQCAASLRQEGFAGHVVLIGDEPSLPYQRPPLSKAYLLGDSRVSDLLFRPPKFYDEQRVQYLRGCAESIDRSARQVTLRSGESVSYDHLVIATGAHRRQLSILGADLDGVMSLQTLADADELRGRLEPGRRAVVVGAGFIGLEFAAVARQLGLEVDVFEVADRALARVASAPSAATLVAAQAELGVRFHFNCGLSAIEGKDGKVTAVRTLGGEIFLADLVLVGIGANARTKLALKAGLGVENGIVVDEQLRTTDEAISAIGDVVAFPMGTTGQRIRLESVQNATDQARMLAARLMGNEAVVAPVPWFWSDQGGLKLQIAGLRADDDTHVVLPQATQPGLIVLCLRDNRLVAVETINRPADHVLARRLITKQVELSAAQVNEPGFQLKSLV